MEDPRTSRGFARNPSYWLYWAGNVGSWAGLAIADVLFLWLVYVHTHSALAVTYVGIAAAIPAIAVGLPAGALADRFNRGVLLVVASLLQATTLGALAVSLLWTGFHLQTVLGLVFAFEGVTAVVKPSANAILPSLVSLDSLDDANGVVQASTSVASTIGAAAAAFVLSVAGLFPAFVLNLLLFFGAAVLFLPIAGQYTAKPGRIPRGRPASLLSDVRGALQYVRSNRGLLELTLLSTALGFFLAMFSPFLVVYTSAELRQAPNVFGYLLGGFSAGFFVASVLAGRLGVVRYYGRFLAAGLVGSGLLVAILVLVPIPVVALGSLTLLGALFGLIGTGFFSLVQRIVPGDMLGRYLSIDETASWGAVPIGILVGGLVIQSAGVLVAYGVTATGLLATGVLAFALRDLRDLRVFSVSSVETPAENSRSEAASNPNAVPLAVAERSAQPLPVFGEVRP